MLSSKWILERHFNFMPKWQGRVMRAAGER